MASKRKCKGNAKSNVLTDIRPDLNHKQYVPPDSKPQREPAKAQAASTLNGSGIGVAGTL